MTFLPASKLSKTRVSLITESLVSYSFIPCKSDYLIHLNMTLSFSFGLRSVSVYTLFTLKSDSSRSFGLAELSALNI